MSVQYIDALRIGKCKDGHDYRYESMITDVHGAEIGFYMQCKRCGARKIVWSDAGDP